jgi:hypothetical protein
MLLQLVKFKKRICEAKYVCLWTVRSRCLKFVVFFNRTLLHIHTPACIHITYLLKSPGRNWPIKIKVQGAHDASDNCHTPFRIVCEEGDVVNVVMERKQACYTVMLLPLHVCYCWGQELHFGKMFVHFGHLHSRWPKSLSWQVKVICTGNTY